MNKDRIWLLISRKVSGEASKEELQELDLLLRADPELSFSHQLLSDHWNTYQGTADELEPAYLRHLERMKAAGLKIIEPENPGEELLIEGSRKTSTRKIVIVSCAFLIVNLLILYQFFPGKQNNNQRVKPETTNQVSTKYGSKTKINLKDGSTVWLNSGSKLIYDSESGNDREAELIGEAYFEIAKNPEKPFVIHTASMDIKVIGTGFNIKSYPGEKTSEAALVHGSIEVSLKNHSSQKILLKPNEKIVVNNDSSAFNTKKNKLTVTDPLIVIQKLSYEPIDSTVVETSWVQNKLIFQNESFKDLAIKLERWYNVKIVFEDFSIQRLRFTGRFENETIDQALCAMSIAEPFTYKIENNLITILNNHY